MYSRKIPVGYRISLFCPHKVKLRPFGVSTKAESLHARIAIKI